MARGFFIGLKRSALVSRGKAEEVIEVNTEYRYWPTGAKI
jgi:hypothetical protein